MNKNIAAYEQIIDFAEKSKNFIQSLELSAQQYDTFLEMMSSLVKMIMAGDQYGIIAYNEKAIDYNKYVKELNQLLKILNDNKE